MGFLIASYFFLIFVFLGACLSKIETKLFLKAAWVLIADILSKISNLNWSPSYCLKLRYIKFFGSTFYQWFSNIHFPSQCLFFERAVDFTISLYDNKNVGSPFFKKFSFQSQFAEVFLNKSVPKKFRKTHRKLYMLVSLFQRSSRLHVEKRLRFRCVLVNFVKFLRTIM